MIPTVDVAPLVGGTGDVEAASRALGEALHDHGFATLVGHGVDSALLPSLEAEARAFFALPEAEKAAVAMSGGGRAWRGWFPAGAELTAGVPDHKEGLYVGQELAGDDPRVRAGLPLHGPNLWPARPPGLRPAVEAWTAAMTGLGHALVAGLGRALDLGEGWFARHLTAEPVTLFRIFRYPPVPPAAEGWGVAEHTDYGLLTLLAQDHHGGLEVRDPLAGWVDVPPDPGALVCNVGDMLDRLTGGRLRSTPHRVRPSAGPGDRLSFPFFFDPSWDAVVEPLPLPGEAPDPVSRWDGTDLQAVGGTYGDYLTAKVAKVFPDLADEVIADP